MFAYSDADSNEAILLLAEAQQELGRWADSLQLLDLADERFSQSEQCCRDVYRVIARRWLGHLSMHGMIEATDQLFEIAMRDIDVETRVKALAGSVRLLALTRNEEQLGRLDELIGIADKLDLDAFQHLHLILTRAWSLSVNKRASAALSEVVRGVTLAEDTSIASSIVVRLLIGKGCLLCMSGQYVDAQDPLEKASTLANRTTRPHWWPMNEWRGLRRRNATAGPCCASTPSNWRSRLYSSASFRWERK